MGLTAPKPDRSRVDRFLTERAEALALKAARTPADISSGEERLEAIVDRAREDHPPQDFSSFVRREGGCDGFANQESVTVVNQGFDRVRDSTPRTNSRQCLDVPDGLE